MSEPVRDVGWDVGWDAGPARRRLRLLSRSDDRRVPDGEPSFPTTYVANRLLVSGFPGSAGHRHFDPLTTALGRLGLRPLITATSARRIDRMQGTCGPARRLLDEIWVTSVELETDGTGLGSPPDAWDVLQRLRHDDPDVAATVSLEHVIRPARFGRPSSTCGATGLLPRCDSVSDPARDSGRCVG